MLRPFLARRRGSNDPYFSSVVSLLHFDGSNGSTTFTDQKSVTWTANGNAQISTAQSKFGGASGLFDGTGDFLTAPHAANFDLSSGDWTLEMYIYITALPGYQHFANKDGVGGSSYSQYGMYIDPSGHLGAIVGSGNGVSAQQLFVGTTVMALNVWHHVALVRWGSMILGFLDGALEMGAALTVAIIDGGKPLYIGWQDAQTGQYFNGNIDDFRMTKGVARYTATNFAPAAAAFPNL